MLTSSSPRGTAPPAVRSRRRDQAPWPIAFYGSAIGKKAVMAVTGIIVLGFVLIHMIGNLKLYLGEDEFGVKHIDTYGEWLRTVGEPAIPENGVLWIFRVVLILSFLLHIHAATTLTLLNRKARPVKYQGGRKYTAADYAARTMRWSGVIVGLYLVFHLMDLTWGTSGVASDSFEKGAVYSNLVESFSRWPVAGVYIVANVLLGIHIYHGAWSLFQSLGLNARRFNPWRRWFAIAFAAVIVIGNVSFPVAVLAGIVE